MEDNKEIMRKKKKEAKLLKKILDHVGHVQFILNKISKVSADP